MGREKARRDDMAKAVTMGMSAEQFEKKFGIEKPYYEARTERELSEAKAYQVLEILIKTDLK